MDLPVLLREIAACGSRLEVGGGKLVCKGPHRLPDGLAAAVREHRDELIRHLAGRDLPGDGGPSTNTFNKIVSDVFGVLDPSLDDSSWVEINGRGFSPAAAKLQRQSTSFGPVGRALPRHCYCCAGTRWWRLRDGCSWVCACCHPTGHAEAEVEWHDAARPADQFPMDPPNGATAPVDARSLEAEVPRG